MITLESVLTFLNDASSRFDEIKELKVHAHQELHLYIDSVNAQTNCKQYNWLMRTVKLPKEKAELDSLKSQLPGGDKVFLIGDAAHAAPICTFTRASPLL